MHVMQLTKANSRSRSLIAHHRHHTYMIMKDVIGEGMGDRPYAATSTFFYFLVFSPLCACMGGADDPLWNELSSARGFAGLNQSWSFHNVGRESHPRMTHRHFDGRVCCTGLETFLL